MASSAAVPPVAVLTDQKARPGGRVRQPGREAGTAPGDRAFRPDVQGLRAVAVTLVLLFHAHVPGVGGGYVGVDVFFVISGFVITGLLLRERASSGATSILHFYGRRIRRIIPAASLVIIASVIASFVVLGPLIGNQTATDARWASVFLINIHFASTGTNYLSSQLPPSVLQNYWSLAVEEQFYLVYPTIFLAVAAVKSRLPIVRRLAIVLSVAVVISFVASVVQTKSDPTAAYFSPLPRVWELALGALVAVSTTSLRRLPAPLAALLSWLGLGGVLAAALAFSASTPYPGWAVALPVVGTALVIAGGVARPTRGAERLLRLRPFQLIGVISYSLYLWHWPILTIAAEHTRSGQLSVSDALLWELFSLVLAVITYLLLENPIRRSRFLATRRWASLALGACLIAATLTVATVELHEHPVGALATPGLANLQTGAGCPQPKQQDLRSLMGPHPVELGHVVARVLLVGDSTACTMLPGMEAVAVPASVEVENGPVVGCGVVSGRIAPDFLNGVDVNAKSSTCQQRAQAAEAQALRSGPPDVVVWASTWERSSLAVGNGPNPKILAAGSAQWYSVVRQRITTRLHQFTATGASVVMLTQAPFAGNEETAADAQAFERLNALLKSIAAQTPHVRIVDLAAHVCPSGPPCPLVVDDVDLRGDGAHYTDEGSLWVARWLMPRLGIKALDKVPAELPVLTVVGLKEGAVLSGIHQLYAYGLFHFGVAKVEFELSGASVGTRPIGAAVFSGGLWTLQWDSRSVPDGSYVVRAVAMGASGDRTVSSGLRVKVVNDTT